MTEFTNVQRERIIRDILNHKIEAREARDPMEADEVQAEEIRLRTLSDSMLKDMWNGRVGEWLCSIGSEFPSFFEEWKDVEREGEYDNPADWQFDKLLDDGDIDYSYQYYQYKTPYTDVDPKTVEDFEIVNYADIRDSLGLILEMEAPDKKENILESLDDSLANNAEYLMLTNGVQ